MTTNLINALVTVPSTSTSRTFGAHLSDKVDVRDFGAKGDGTTDDTSAIQAAVNYACTNDKCLIFPQANSGQFYKISDRILIPYNTYHWSIRGVPHRTKIHQMTDNKPIFHFDSLGTSPPGSTYDLVNLTNSAFEIANFACRWQNNQPVTNTHAACVEFNDGGWADFVIECMECVNGTRCITHQYPGQTVGRSLNVWGCIFRHLFMGSTASGAAIYLRSNPTEGLPNILVSHVYSVQANGAEELMHFAGATSVSIDCVEQNFGGFTPGFVAWAGSGNISIRNWRLEVFSWTNAVGSGPAYFDLNGSGTQYTEYQIENFEMRFNTINLPSGDKYVTQTSGARLTFNGFFDPGGTFTAGNVYLCNPQSASDNYEVGISTIINGPIRFAKGNNAFLGQINFTGGTRVMEFYKGSLTTNMSAVINDAGGVIKGKTIAVTGWIWSLRVNLDVAVSAGQIQFVVYVNGTALDTSNFTLTMTSGNKAVIYNVMLKNQTAAAGYKLSPGDVIDVRTTSNASLAGPANAVMVVTVAHI